MEHVLINWRGPYLFETAGERDENYDWGLYSISRVFGENNTLLYIGQSYKQTMLDRIWDHEYKWIDLYRGQMRVNFGSIELLDSDRHSKSRTLDIEALLIFKNQPLHNKQHKHSYSGRELSVVSRGRHGLLKKYVSHKFD